MQGWRILIENTLQSMTDKKFDEESIEGVRFFMTGDGHREPPFRWINVCDKIKEIFAEAVKNGRLCAHVEQLQADVNVKSVPALLQPLIATSRVFGWELPLFGELNLIMRTSMELIDGINGKGVLSSTATKFRDEVNKVAPYVTPLEAKDELKGPLKTLVDAKEWVDGMCSYVSKAFVLPNRRTSEKNTLYTNYLLAYNNAVMELRTDEKVHRLIGRSIEHHINQYPNDVHVITCGYQHIKTDNPLHKFVNIGNARGVVDALKG